MSLFAAAWVIARRDFLATVYSKTFIIFMLAPIMIVAISVGLGQAQGRADREATQSNVALLMSRADVAAISSAREDLVAATSQLTFPKVTAVDSETDQQAQARRLLADTQANYSGVLIGSLDQPTLVGPARVDDTIGPELSLIVGSAREGQALAAAGRQPEAVRLERIQTDNAAGNLHTTRHLLARLAQLVIFMVTMTLATVLVSSFLEEKSNKIIEVLAAAVSVDAIFLGKLLATLGVALIGLTFWSGLIALGYMFIQALQSWVQIPAEPAIGWPAFLILAPLYFSANFLLFGGVFLGIGSQAASPREVQTISVPLVVAQVLVMMLAGQTISASGDSWTAWAAYVFPLSSPLAMTAFAVQSDLIWPHLLALAWQTIWVFVTVRIATVLFRTFVMKSGGPVSLMPRVRARG